MPPDVPRRNVIGLTPPVFKLSPANITVTRFAVLGMPVKSTDVPDALTAVPDTNGYSVPVGTVKLEPVNVVPATPPVNVPPPCGIALAIEVRV
jgi:hypothetical protein